MNTITDIMIQDRTQAGKLLGKKLEDYKDGIAVVIGVPHGGVCVAYALAEDLNLQLEIMPCRKMKHPADSAKNIGSVSIDEAFIHDCPHTIPQDYICHQVALLRSAIQAENKFYYGNRNPVSLLYKTVILGSSYSMVASMMFLCYR